MADRPRRRAPAGRADAWRRRGGAQRDLPHHHRARAGRHGGRHGVIGHAGDPQPLPPGPGHAGRRRRGRARPGCPLGARRPGESLPPRSRTRPRRPGPGSAPRRGRQPIRRRGPPAPRPAPPCHRPPRRTCDEHARGSARSAVQRHGNRTGGRRALQRRLVPRPAHPPRDGRGDAADHRLLQLPQCPVRHARQHPDHRHRGRARSRSSRSGRPS